MSDIHNQEEITFLENIGDRYSILSENGEFKNFKGLVKGESSDLYIFSGEIYTGGHILIIDGDEFEVRDMVGAKRLYLPQPVYEPLDVEDTHTYISNGFLNKNCTTGDNTVNIRDKNFNQFSWGAVG